MSASASRRASTVIEMTVELRIGPESRAAVRQCVEACLGEPSPQFRTQLAALIEAAIDTLSDLGGLDIRVRRIASSAMREDAA